MLVRSSGSGATGSASALGSCQRNRNHCAGAELLWFFDNHRSLTIRIDAALERKARLGAKIRGDGPGQYASGHHASAPICCTVFYKTEGVFCSGQTLNRSGFTGAADAFSVQKFRVLHEKTRFPFRGQFKTSCQETT
jgi:hypothetical protein